MPALESPPLSKAQLAAARLTSISDETWGAMVRGQNNAIIALWRNDDATPQEVCDELGTDAVASFDEHARLTDFIVAQNIRDGKDPLAKVLLPTNAFTRNVDGSVTIGTDPYVP